MGGDDGRRRTTRARNKAAHAFRPGRRALRSARLLARRRAVSMAVRQEGARRVAAQPPRPGRAPSPRATGAQGVDGARWDDSADWAAFAGDRSEDPMMAAPLAADNDGELQRAHPQRPPPDLGGSGQSVSVLREQEHRMRADGPSSAERRAAAVVVPGDVVTREAGYMRCVGGDRCRTAHAPWYAVDAATPRGGLLGGRSGHGTYADGDKLLSSVAGIVTPVNRLLCVHPLRGRYVGEIGDVVVGRIVEVSQRRWSVDVNARLDAVLMLSAVHLPGGVLVRCANGMPPQLANAMAIRAIAAAGRCTTGTLTRSTKCRITIALPARGSSNGTPPGSYSSAPPYVRSAAPEIRGRRAGNARVPGRK